MPAEQVSLLTQGLESARSFLWRTTRVSIDGVTLSIEGRGRPGEGAKVDLPATIKIFVEHPMWADAPSWLVAKTAAHEYYHVVQATLSRLVTATILPQWLKEGSAELFGFSVVADAGLYDYGTARSEVIARAKTFTETLPRCGGDCAYPLGFVAAEYVARPGGLARLSSLFTALGGGAAINKSGPLAAFWRSSFQRVFRMPLERFYAAFESYRRTL